MLLECGALAAWQPADPAAADPAAAGGPAGGSGGGWRRAEVVEAAHNGCVGIFVAEMFVKLQTFGLGLPLPASVRGCCAGLFGRAEAGVASPGSKKAELHAMVRSNEDFASCPQREPYQLSAVR